MLTRIALFALALALADPSAAQTPDVPPAPSHAGPPLTYEVPIGAATNRLDLVLVSESEGAGESPGRLRTALVSAPEWLIVRPAEVEVSLSAEAPEAEATFEFELAAGARVGDEGRITFDVFEGDALVTSKSFRFLVAAPQRFELIGTYPNPFSGTATVAYVLPEEGRVDFEVFDVLGRKVIERSTWLAAGRHEETLDGAGLSAGLYLWRLSVASAGGNVVKVGSITKG